MTQSLTTSQLESQRRRRSALHLNTEGEDKERLKISQSIYETTVPRQFKAFFEDEWIPSSHEVLSAFNGFLTREIHIISEDTEQIKYFIMIKFRSLESLQEWFLSTNRTGILVQLNEKGIHGRRIDNYGGNEKITKNRRIVLHDILSEAPRALPPPKWKLFIIIYLQLMGALFLIEVGGSAPLLVEAGFTESMVLFFTLSHLIPLFAFASIPLIISIPVVNYWLRISRPSPEKMHPLVRILDQGFGIFAAKPASVPPEIIKKLEEVEYKLNVLRQKYHELHLSYDGRNLTFEDNENITQQNYNDDQTKLLRKVGQIKLEQPEEKTLNNDKTITMIAKHFVKWEKVPAFEEWTDEMELEMSKHPGFLGLTRFAPAKEGAPYINSFSYDSYENFHSFICDSGKRTELLNELENMLQATSVAELNNERVIRDAFSDLLVATGSSVPNRPPPVWKSCLLTLISIFIIAWQAGNNFGLYLDAETNIDYLVIRFLTPMLNVLMNVYIGVPLMQSQFGSWLVMERVRSDNILVRYMDEGFPKGIQFFIVFVYIVLNLMPILTEK